MIHYHLIKERRVRNLLFYTGVSIITIVSVLTSLGSSNQLVALNNVIEFFSDIFPIINNIGYATPNPIASRTIVFTMLIVFLVLTAPIAYLQYKIQDFPNTKPIITKYGWCFGVFLAAPWLLNPGNGSGRRSEFLNKLLAVGPVGTGIFSVLVYLLLVLSAVSITLFVVSRFRKN